MIDGATNTVIGTPITIGQTPRGVAVNESTKRIYVANAGQNSVSVIDATTATVIDTVVEVGNQPYGVAVNATTNRVYVANQNDSSVTLIPQ